MELAQSWKRIAFGTTGFRRTHITDALYSSLLPLSHATDELTASPQSLNHVWNLWTHVHTLTTNPYTSPHSTPPLSLSHFI